MKQTLFPGLIRPILPVLVGLTLVAATASGVRPVVDARRVQSSCSDSPNDCKSPVRYLGEKDGCACFVCEYGKKTQRTICTTNKLDRAKLITKVRESMPKK